MRERVAIVVMALSLLAAMGLGGAVAVQLGKSSPVGTTVQAVGPSTAASGQTGTAATQGVQGTAGRSVTIGGSAGQAGKLSTAGEGVSHGVITVGGIYDETGPVDSTVERDAVRAYFDKVNDGGGVNGYKLRLIDCDSAYDPTQAHECATRLLEQGVLAFVGSNSVSGEEPETKNLTQQGVPSGSRTPPSCSSA